MKRVVRYMKKWKNQHFNTSGNNAPTGIALTALACNYFAPHYIKDFWTNKKTYDDFKAIKALVNNIQNAFTLTWDSDDRCFYQTITQALPVQPGNNLFEKMTNKQMNNFYEQICTMYSKFTEAEGKSKKSEVCQLMIDVFGEAFPAAVDRSYVGTSESA